MVFKVFGFKTDNDDNTVDHAARFEGISFHSTDSTD